MNARSTIPARIWAFTQASPTGAPLNQHC